jgi:hypothetical protein
MAMGQTAPHQLCRVLLGALAQMGALAQVYKRFGANGRLSAGVGRLGADRRLGAGAQNALAQVKRLSAGAVGCAPAGAGARPDCWRS